MTIRNWLETALQDADRRGLPELRPLLEMLARSTAALRAAEWNADAAGQAPPPRPLASPDPSTERPGHGR